MARFFQNEEYACVETRMSGPWDNRKPTNETFVQLHTPEGQDRILKVIKAKEHSKGLKSASGAAIRVSHMRNDFQRSRDWAMRKSEELIQAEGGVTKFEKSKDFRKITVKGKDAFVQLRGDEQGSFVEGYAHLSLP